MRPWLTSRLSYSWKNNSQKEVLVKCGIFGVIEKTYGDVGNTVNGGNPIA